jgi:hypothetical protein
MCNPVALAGASFAMGAGQSILGFGQAQEQADRQNAYYEQNAIAAQTAMVNTYAGETTQETEARNSASQQMFQNEVKGAQAQGTALTAAGQAGVGGLSVDELLNSEGAQTARQQDAVTQNYQMQDTSIRNQMQSTHDQALAEINSVQTAAPPSPLMLGLGIASAGVGAAGQFYRDTYTSQRGGMYPGYYNPQDAALGGVNYPQPYEG